MGSTGEGEKQRHAILPLSHAPPLALFLLPIALHSIAQLADSLFVDFVSVLFE